MFVKLDPPGSFCQYEALRDLLKGREIDSFVDVGCGGGDVSKLLCSLGLRGIGIDFSPAAIEAANRKLSGEIGRGQYQLVQSDVTSDRLSLTKSDLGVSIMVMEHIADDSGYVRTVSQLVRPGGLVVFCVPGRKDHWSFEDETVGHLRRYDRKDLRALLEVSGLTDVEVWSLSVPTANVLVGIGNALARRAGEGRKRNLTKIEQTKTSGLREIPWKTTFPSVFRLILNRYTLYPLLVIQRLFYHTDLGIAILGFGRVPDAK